MTTAPVHLTVSVLARSSLTTTPEMTQLFQVLRQRQLTVGSGGNMLYPITTSSSWPPTNPIHIKQEIQIPQVR